MVHASLLPFKSKNQKRGLTNTQKSINCTINVIAHKGDNLMAKTVQELQALLQNEEETPIEIQLMGPA